MVHISSIRLEVLLAFFLGCAISSQVQEWSLVTPTDFLDREKRNKMSKTGLSLLLGFGETVRCLMEIYYTEKSALHKSDVLW